MLLLLLLVVLVLLVLLLLSVKLIFVLLLLLLLLLLTLHVQTTIDPRNESLLYVGEVQCNQDGPLYLDNACKSTARANGGYFTGVRKLELHPNGTCASVSTVAGAKIGFNGDGSTKTTDFDYVHGVQFRPLAPGELRGRGSTVFWVMDDLNERIRRIDVAAGTVTTLAGNGTAGHGRGTGCHDGPGAQATFNAVGLSVDKDENVYVADYGNHRIRKLSVKAKTEDLLSFRDAQTLQTA